MDYKEILDNLKCQTNNGNTFKIIECGSNIFIHFWATWCSPCRNEIPELQKIYNEYKNNTDFLFISCDNNKTDIDTFVTNKQLTMPIGYDLNNEIANLFNIRSIPSSFFIKRTPNKTYNVKNIVGAMDYKTLKKNFEEFIAQL
jgi:thiol-disulfide isomerase/thioredoxin